MVVPCIPNLPFTKLYLQGTPDAHTIHHPVVHVQAPRHQPGGAASTDLCYGVRRRSLLRPDNVMSAVALAEALVGVLGVACRSVQAALLVGVCRVPWWGWLGPFPLVSQVQTQPAPSRAG